MAFLQDASHHMEIVLIRLCWLKIGQDFMFSSSIRWSGENQVIHCKIPRSRR